MIEKFIDEGKIRTVDGLNMGHAVKLLTNKQADFTSMLKISSLYVFKQLKALTKIHYSKRPLFSFQRMVLLPTSLKALKPWLDKRIQLSSSDPLWLTSIKKYGLESIIIKYANPVMQ